MSKEGPSYKEASPRTILSSANQGHWRGKQHTLKDNPPSRPKQKANTVGQLWGRGGWAILGEAVTSALNTRSWQSGRINEEMTPE